MDPRQSRGRGQSNRGLAEIVASAASGREDSVLLAVLLLVERILQCATLLMRWSPPMSLSSSRKIQTDQLNGLISEFPNSHQGKGTGAAGSQSVCGGT